MWVRALQPYVVTGQLHLAEAVALILEGSTKMFLDVFQQQQIRSFLFKQTIFLKQKKNLSGRQSGMYCSHVDCTVMQFVQA